MTHMREEASLATDIVAEEAAADALVAAEAAAATRPAPATKVEVELVMVALEEMAEAEVILERD